MNNIKNVLLSEAGLKGSLKVISDIASKAKSKLSPVEFDADVLPRALEKISGLTAILKSP